jgi:hypothetical protein
MTAILTEGDVDRGRGPDVAEHAFQRRAGSRELPPEFCRRGHRAPWFLLAWEPGKGRRYDCAVPGCDSVQFRR